MKMPGRGRSPRPLDDQVPVASPGQEMGNSEQGPAGPRAAMADQGMGGREQPMRSAHNTPLPATSIWSDRLGRKAVQIGFLLLCLYPFVPAIYGRLTGNAAPGLSSWLLPWDPLLFLGHLVHRDWAVVVIGAPLLLLALTACLGRVFCGWVCPIGTVLDCARTVAQARPAGGLGSSVLRQPQGRRGPRGRSRRARRVLWFPDTANSRLRFAVLGAAVAGGVLSLQLLGALDPLVVFQRTATLVLADSLALQQTLLRTYLTASGIFIAIVALELWQPRFWCRHLCPLGALLNLASRRSLLARRVSEACNGCGECRRACPMRAIPKEGHDTNYGDCHFCLICEGLCPRGAISFGPGALAGRRWHAEGQGAGPDGKPCLWGHYAPEPAPRPELTRRTFLAGLAAAGAGLALPATLHAMPQVPMVRPPGALPEADFLRTCILCQECVRICPTTGLRPTIWQAGIAGVGTPQVKGRLGGCLFVPSCPQLCAQVCPAGAIRPITRAQMKLGRASVDHSACLAWDQGVKCLVCVEACPTGAAGPFDGRVVVDPLKCTGCGRCENACPVADSAIHVYPLASI